MQEQALSLVVKPSGKIEKLAGDHDDWINAAAGAVVVAAADSGPALIRKEDVLVNDTPVPMPQRAQSLMTVLMVGDDGMVATCHFACHEEYRVADRHPLVLLDFSFAPLSGTTIIDADEKAKVLESEIRGTLFRRLWMPAPLAQTAEMSGLTASPIPDEFLRDPSGLALAAAGHVAAGRVKVTERAMERAYSAPLLGALSFSSGEKIDRNPLRMAFLLGIAIGLPVGRAFQPPQMPATRIG